MESAQNAPEIESQEAGAWGIDRYPSPEEETIGLSH